MITSSRATFTRILLLLMAYSSPLVCAARADDGKLEPGTIAIVVPAELQNDWTVRSDAGADGLNLHTKIEPELTFQATERLSFLLGLTLEQLTPPDRGEDDAFEHEALYIKTLTVNYQTEPFAVFAGKFTPNFGRAWDIAPGIYGDEFAKDYEFAERWGGGGSLAFDETPLGDLTLSASVFFVDRTALSDSWITRRGRTTAADGGPGNTGDLPSFAIALDGGSLPLYESLDYHIAYTRQAKGDGDTGTLQGFVAGAQATIPLTGELGMTPLVEWARFDNFAGVRGADRTVWTAALQFDYGPWQLVTAYAKRFIADAVDDRSFELTGGYNFASGVLAELGWWHVKDAGESADIIGARLSYELGTQLRLY